MRAVLHDPILMHGTRISLVYLIQKFGTDAAGAEEPRPRDKHQAPTSRPRDEEPRPRDDISQTYHQYIARANISPIHHRYWPTTDLIGQ